MKRRDLLLMSPAALLAGGCAKKEDMTASLKTKAKALRRPAGAVSAVDPILEGKVLAAYLLCTHQTHLHALASYQYANTTAQLKAVLDEGTYAKVHAAMAANSDIAAAVVAFTDAFQILMSAASPASGDGDGPYPDNPDACLTCETINNLQSVGLLRAVPSNTPQPTCD